MLGVPYCSYSQYSIRRNTILIIKAPILEPKKAGDCRMADGKLDEGAAAHLGLFMVG